jgi:hypothetical protein
MVDCEARFQTVCLHVCMRDCMCDGVPAPMRAEGLRRAEGVHVRRGRESQGWATFD